MLNNNAKETYDYDQYPRLEKIHRWLPNGSEDTAQLQTFTYDTNSPGLLATAAFATNVGSALQLSLQYSYSYTPAGKVSGKTLSLTSGNHNSGYPNYTPASGSVSVSYSYDSQGTLTNIAYPKLGSTLSLTYSLDSMERPTGLSDLSNNNWVSGVTYNAANQMLGGTIAGYTEVDTYNTLYQLNQRTMSHQGSTAFGLTYNFGGTGKNNGQIVSSVNAVNGETITYQYDALKRLISGSSTASWSSGYTYDGFGNLAAISGSGGAPNTGATAPDWHTNRIAPTGVGYDGNGNMTSMAGMTLGYDVANRLVSVSGSSGSGVYAYDPQNRRVLAEINGADSSLECRHSMPFKLRMDLVCQAGGRPNEDRSSKSASIRSRASE